jgi:hypothetical protein
VVSVRRMQVEPPNERLYQFVGQLKLGPPPLHPFPATAESADDPTSPINAENVRAAFTRAWRCAAIGLHDRARIRGAARI